MSMKRKYPIKTTGSTVGAMTLLSFFNNRNGIASVWECQCVCGKILFVPEHAMQNPTRLKGCGCTKRAITSAIHTKHGMTARPEYGIWKGIKARCTIKSARGYDGYGGRGIVVCERWFGSFQNFFDDMGPRPSKKHTIERKDNDGPYSPENCEWVTIETQSRNTRRTRLFTHDGVTLCAKDWSKRIGIKYVTFIARLKSGVSIEEIVRAENRAKRMITFDGQTMSLADWSRKLGLPEGMISRRLASGWTIERSLSPKMHD